MISKKNIKNLILSDIHREIVLFEDTASLDNIETDYLNEYRYLSEEAKKFIDANFSKAKKEDSKLFNNDLIGLRNFDVYGGKIFINYEKGDYKTYLATKNIKYKQYIKNNEFFIIPIGVINIVVTKDNRVIIGRSKEKEYKLVGGFVDFRDLHNGKIDFMKCANREVQEEVGNIELYDNLLIGVYSLNCSCAVVISHSIDYTSKEIIEIWQNNENNEKYGIEDMLFLKNKEEDIGNAIKDKRLSCHARIAFKFHLKANFSNYKYMNIKIE